MVQSISGVFIIRPIVKCKHLLFKITVKRILRYPTNKNSKYIVLTLKKYPILDEKLFF